MGIKVKPAHVAIVVQDLCRSTDFYCHVLGARVASIHDDPHSPVAIVLLEIGGLTVELLHYRAEDAPRALGRVDHLAFYVENMEAAMAMLNQLQVERIDAVPRKVHGSQQILFFRGPDGERIEFIQK